MILQQLHDKGLIKPPKFLLTNTVYLTVMGSVAYGVSSDSSDYDVYGVAIPPKTTLFPHLAGVIPGFGYQGERFDQWQQHHIVDPSALGGHGREYDFQLFNIVKYFQLAMDNNPNIIDSLFTPVTCVLHSTGVGNLMREHRRLFLHKGCWSKLRGYAFSQLHKMQTKDPQGKRKELRDAHGFDSKYGYHLVRLLLEAEQILETGDLDLQKDNEFLKAIRRGEYGEEQIREFFARKEKALDELHARSTLRAAPDEPALKRLLLNCLEEHYGNLKDAVVEVGKAERVVADIRRLIEGAGL